MASHVVAMADKEMTSNERGTYSELLAQSALLANGWAVSIPIGAQAYDLSIRRPGSKKTYYCQVKTAFLRNTENDLKRYKRAYLKVPGAKNSGQVYTKDEVDYFIAVWKGECYMFINREKTEYWTAEERVAETWTKL